MKKLAAMFAMLFIVSGCSTQYRNIDPSRNNQHTFDQDSAYCNAVAVGSVPMPNTPYVPAVTQSYTTGSGTITDSRGNMYMGSYNQMTTHTNPAAAGQALTNLGNQLEATGARITIYNHCISQRGWREVSKQEYEAMNNRQANTQHYQPPSAQHYREAAEQGNVEAQSKIVAVVNGERVTALDVERKAMPELKQRGLNANNPEQRVQIDAVYKEALDAAINEILVYQEALRLKTELPESDVDKEITRLMQQRKLSPEELEKQLQQEGLGTQKLREQIRKNLLRQRLLTNMVARKIILSKDEIAQYYKEHKDSFKTISEVRMAIIAYAPDVNADAIAQRIKSGTLSFEEAVRQYSVDTSTKQNNGVMPSAPWKGMSPEWRARVSAMKAGEVSDIFIIPHPQYQIKAQIKLLEKVGDDKVLSLAEATPEIEAVLREPLLKARFEEYTQWLRSRAIVDITSL